MNKFINRYKLKITENNNKAYIDENSEYVKQ